MLLTSLALNWLIGADAFRLDPAALHIDGLAYTAEQEVRDRLGLAGDARPNVFRLRTAAMAGALSTLPTVAAADVGVALPDRIVIRVTEREPVLVWRTPSGAFLADVEGALISAVAAAPTGLPLIDDRRQASQQLAVGDFVDPVDVAAVLRLAAITPAMLGSRASTLELSVDDADGYVLRSPDPPWRAVFGPYTANLRTPEANIDRQVQCLRSLLGQGEERVEVVYLAVADDACGTFRERPTPSARIFQNVGRSPTPAGGA